MGCAAGPALVRGVRCYHSWFEHRDEDIKKRAEGAKLGGIIAPAEPCSSEGPWHVGETSRSSTKGDAMSCRGEGITPEDAKREYITKVEQFFSAWQQLGSEQPSWVPGVRWRVLEQPRGGCRRVLQSSASLLGAGLGQPASG